MNLRTIFVLNLMIFCVHACNDNCPILDPNAINVHIICHSHNDVGWIHTVAWYYDNSVRIIINNVIQALEDNPARRFVQVESAFLNQWWVSHNETQRNRFKKLVDNGQIEIIGGAWSMNDEATTYYQSIIDQFSLGLKFLKDSVGDCGRPKIGWQIDPFGHSFEMASIFQQMDYDAFFIGRLDHIDFVNKLTNKDLNFLWNNNRYEKQPLFSSILYDFYISPGEFCLHENCNFYAQNTARGFKTTIERQMTVYKTNNIMITIGGDFTFEYASITFDRLDKVLKLMKNYVTSGKKKINIFYSTPSCYIKAVNEQATIKNISYTKQTADFFPYSSEYHKYWTGFYTSRPTIKGMERQGNNLLQIVKQLAVFLPRETDNSPEVYDLQKAMGIMQHHDAITGTEKLHVAKDYAKILHAAMNKASTASGKIILNILNKTDNLNLISCPLLNISVCYVTKASSFLLAVYNPLAKTVSPYISIPVTKSFYVVMDNAGKTILYQISPKIAIANTSQKNQLVFLAENIPPLGVNFYKIDSKNVDRPIGFVEGNQKFKLGNKLTGFELDAYGYLSSITLNGKRLKLKQQLMYYTGSSEDYRRSGAYIFRPYKEPYKLRLSSFKVYKGHLYQEVQQKFNNWAKQTIRTYRNKDYIEIEWIIGAIPMNDGFSKEVISRFMTSMNSKDVFYTDSNGRQEIYRKRNYRKTYSYTNDEPVAGNYYPVTTKISIEDGKDDMKFSVYTDRAQGASSLKSGEIELMLHRQTLYDDYLGVEEPLLEKEFLSGSTVTGKHYITLDSVYTDDQTLDFTLKPWVFFSKVPKKFNFTEFRFSGLLKSLPKNVHLLTLEPWSVSENLILIRLEYREKFTESVTVDLYELFTLFDIQLLEETTLDGNMAYQKDYRYKWNGNQNATRDTRPNDDLSNLKLELRPMEIRTFIAKIMYK